MGIRWSALAAAAALGCFSGGLYGAVAHEKDHCTVIFDQSSPPTYHYGHEHRDVCHAGDGADSMYGYAGGDSLYGGNGNDKLRGAVGQDELFDSFGDGDDDKFCDGDDIDHINMADGDTADHFHQVQDSWAEIIDRNVGDEYHSQGDLHNECPM